MKKVNGFLGVEIRPMRVGGQAVSVRYKM